MSTESSVKVNQMHLHSWLCKSNDDTAILSDQSLVSSPRTLTEVIQYCVFLIENQIRPVESSQVELVAAVAQLLEKRACHRKGCQFDPQEKMCAELVKHTQLNSSFSMEKLDLQPTKLAAAKKTNT